MNGTRLERYLLLDPIGQGGMSTVWRARDELTLQDVAVKLLADHLAHSSTAKRRFLREARNSAALDHPGIVGVLGSGEQDGHAWIAFRLVNGESLSSHIARAPLPLPEVLRILQCIADALQHAHDRGIVHRDVKSNNVMVARDGRVFVLDFGLAVARGDEPLTSSQVQIGTLASMAPEVALRNPADERSDIYGLGVIAYEALTGQLPFQSSHPAGLLYAIVNEQPRPPSQLRADVFPEIDRVVLRAMARDPEARPVSAASFACELEEAFRTATARPAAQGSEAAAAHVEPQPPLPVSRVFLAVLPFDDLGPAEDPAEPRHLLAHGLSDALSAALARSGQIHVVSGTGGPGHAQDHSVLARRLGANRLLTGQVRRSGAEIRVTFSVLDPFTGVRLAGGSVTGPFVELFELEDRLIAEASKALQLDDPVASRRRSRAGKDPAAHERLLQARGYLVRYDSSAAVDGAIRLLEDLIERDAETGERLALLGRALLMKYRLSHDRRLEARAASACERAIQLAPDSTEVLLTLGELKLAAGQFEAARSTFERCHELRPGTEALIGQARALEALGETGTAEAALRQAIALRPDSWAPFNWLGLLYLHTARYAEAIEAWRKVAGLAPDHALVHTNLAAAHFHLGEFDDAIRECQFALAFQPTARALMTLGSSCYYQGTFEEAAEAFEKAASLQPSDAGAWSGLGAVCRQIPGAEARARKALVRAETLLRDRTDRSPGDGAAWAQLATCLANLGHTQTSREAIERAVALRPDSIEVMIAAVGVYQSCDPDRALECLKAAVDSGYRAASVVRDPALTPLHTHPRFWSIVGPTSQRRVRE